jgi:hypothetical protein
VSLEPVGFFQPSLGDFVELLFQGRVLFCMMVVFIDNRAFPQGVVSGESHHFGFITPGSIGRGIENKVFTDADRAEIKIPNRIFVFLTAAYHYELLSVPFAELDKFLGSGPVVLRSADRFSVDKKHFAPVLVSDKPFRHGEGKCGDIVIQQQGGKRIGPEFFQKFQTGDCLGIGHDTAVS